VNDDEWRDAVDAMTEVEHGRIEDADMFDLEGNRLHE
jgi:hypothetical protein